MEDEDDNEDGEDNEDSSETVNEKKRLGKFLSVCSSLIGFWFQLDNSILFQSI